LGDFFYCLGTIRKEKGDVQVQVLGSGKFHFDQSQELQEARQTIAVAREDFKQVGLKLVKTETKLRVCSERQSALDNKPVLGLGEQQELQAQADLTRFAVCYSQMYEYFFGIQGVAKCK
jgi:alkaline phosphatase